MAVMASTLTAYGFQTGSSGRITRIIDKGPGPVEGSGTQITGTLRNHITGSIADRAIDAFDRLAGSKTLW